MKPLYVLALVSLVVGCHFDKLFSGGDTGPPRSHATPRGLAFSTHPGPARVGQPLDPIRVAVVDSAGTTVAGADSLITIALGNNPGSATLRGTDTARAANGVATFRDLRIDQPGTGYTLQASGGGLTPQTSDPFDVMPPPTTTGDLTVTARTTGGTPDPNGYTVTVDGGASQSVLANGSVTFSPVPSGTHTVDLSDVAPNCTVTNGPQRTVTVPVNGTGTATFDITCPTPPPTTGDLTVTTTTGGTGSDPNGYTLTVDGAPQAIAMNGSRTITGLLAGNHSVGLSDLASQCVVSGQNPRTVNVPAGSATRTDFLVTCTAPVNQPPTAGFTPNCNGLTCDFTSTSSDPDGSIVSYAWTFGDGGTSTAQNPSRTYARDGSYHVTLTVQDNQGATNAVSQDVNVSAPPPPPPPNQPPSVNAGTDPQRVLIGLLFTLEGASFSDPDNGPWTVTIDWGDNSSQTTIPMSSPGPINASHSYRDLLLATHTLTVTVEDALHARRSASKTVLVVLSL